MAHLPDGTRLANLNTGEWIFNGKIPNWAIIRATIYRHGKAVQILDNPHYRGPLGRSARGGTNAPRPRESRPATIGSSLSHAPHDGCVRR
jgi:hypothetical protein